jgi:DNA modification methylase
MAAKSATKKNTPTTPTANAVWRNRIVGYGDEQPDQLLANPANWRIHPRSQQQALAGVLSEVGWVSEVLVNKTTGHVVDGHLRVELAISRNEPTVPVKYVELSEAEEQLILATIDPLSAMAVTDSDKLNELLSGLETDNADLQALIEDIARVNDIDLSGEPAPDPGAQLDNADELQANWQVKRGDVWTIGKHRLMCGDSTDAVEVEKLMQGEKAQLIMTSPPYWVGKEYENEQSWDAILNFIAQVSEHMAAVVIEQGRIVINTGTAQVGRFHDHAEMSLILDEWQRALRTFGWLMRHPRIWAKNGGLGGLVGPQSDVVDVHWEFIATFYKPHKPFVGQRRLDAAWANQGLWTDIQGNATENDHVASFPVEIPARNIRLYSDKGGIVFEPFSGAGTTIVASEQWERRCFAMEFLPKYCSVTLERLSAMGLTPELDNG